MLLCALSLGACATPFNANVSRFQAELPVAYVRREDWARGQSVIEAKLDGLALRYENILLKGAPRHD